MSLRPLPPQHASRSSLTSCSARRWSRSAGRLRSRCCMRREGPRLDRERRSSGVWWQRWRRRASSSVSACSGSCSTSQPRVRSCCSSGRRRRCWTSWSRRDSQGGPLRRAGALAAALVCGLQRSTSEDCLQRARRRDACAAAGARCQRTRSWRAAGGARDRYRRRGGGRRGRRVSGCGGRGARGRVVGRIVAPFQIGAQRSQCFLSHRHTVRPSRCL